MQYKVVDGGQPWISNVGTKGWMEKGFDLSRLGSSRRKERETNNNNNNNGINNNMAAMVVASQEELQEGMTNGREIDLSIDPSEHSRSDRSIGVLISD